MQKSKSNCIVILSLTLFIIPFFVFAQEKSDTGSFVTNRFRVVFYNVENLFDTIDDPQTQDEEFLPNQGKYWNNKRFNTKLNRIAQVVVAVGEWSPPVLVGLCEVENYNVVEKLVKNTPLGEMDYRIIHKESPDLRGIDVALLYLNPYFEPISYKAIPLNDPQNSEFRSRDILYVKGIIAADTLHIFVNHWPSKFGGAVDSEPKRFLAASLLKSQTDSLFVLNPNSKILIMGDFNDTPSDRSVSEKLGAIPCQNHSLVAPLLYNLSSKLEQEGKGSHKYQAEWNLIDQMIVSGALLENRKKGLSAHCGAFRIYEAPFLLEPDKNYLGKKPFRTYVGFRYNNGFSDHLPVYLDLFVNQKGD